MRSKFQNLPENHIKIVYMLVLSPSQYSIKLFAVFVPLLFVLQRELFWKEKAASISVLQRLKLPGLQPENTYHCLKFGCYLDAQCTEIFSLSQMLLSSFSSVFQRPQSQKIMFNLGFAFMSQMKKNHSSLLIYKSFLFRFWRLFLRFRALQTQLKVFFYDMKYIFALCFY